MRPKSLPDEPPALPIKIDATSNGEFVPRPSPDVERVRRLAHTRIDEAARDRGVSRRDFVRTSSAAATVLLAMNELGCGGGRYAVPKEAPHDEAAAATAVEGDDFIFDVQTHHVSTQRSWWDEAEHTQKEFLLKQEQARCGRGFPGCFDRDVYLKELFLDSDTDMVVMSALWGTEPMNPILVEEMAQTRERMAKLDPPHRLRIHGLVRPETKAREETRDRMQALLEDWKISAWKLYPVWTPDGKGYRLDDEETGLFAIREGVRLGLPLFAIHKGLPLPGAANAFTSAIDVGPAAKAVPEATLLVYHSGYHPDHVEGPWDPSSKLGIDGLINGLKAAGIGQDGNVYAELGSTWRRVMQKPDEAAHLLGKLLVHLGEDRILWGTDSIWYGSPQDQIQAFRAFEISKELQEKHGYPALTREIKAKIFGLNAARVYGVDVDEVRRAQAKDAVTRARLEYRNDPRPSFRTYGPRTRAELFGMLRRTGPLGH